VQLVNLNWGSILKLQYYVQRYTVPLTPPPPPPSLFLFLTEQKGYRVLNIVVTSHFSWIVVTSLSIYDSRVLDIVVIHLSSHRKHCVDACDAWNGLKSSEKLINRRIFFPMDASQMCTTCLLINGTKLWLNTGFELRITYSNTILGNSEFNHLTTILTSTKCLLINGIGSLAFFSYINITCIHVYTHKKTF
jgi:hypothetical protein